MGMSLVMRYVISMSKLAMYALFSRQTAFAADSMLITTASCVGKARWGNAKQDVGAWCQIASASPATEPRNSQATSQPGTTRSKSPKKWGVWVDTNTDSLGGKGGGGGRAGEPLKRKTGPATDWLNVPIGRGAETAAVRTLAARRPVAVALAPSA